YVIKQCRNRATPAHSRYSLLLAFREALLPFQSSSRPDKHAPEDSRFSYRRVLLSIARRLLLPPPTTHLPLLRSSPYGLFASDFLPAIPERYCPVDWL